MPEEIIKCQHCGRKIIHITYTDTVGGRARCFDMGYLEVDKKNNTTMEVQKMLRIPIRKLKSHKCK